LDIRFGKFFKIMSSFKKIFIPILIFSLAFFSFAKAQTNGDEKVGGEGEGIGGKVSVATYEWCPGAGINPIEWFKCIVEYLVSLPIRGIFFLFLIPGIILGFVGGVIYLLVAGLANWAIEITFSAPIVRNALVSAGWDITKNFANMFFALFLVFIGLATILKIGEYGARKRLATLLIVALLINFVPVMVSLIVDVGNIFCYYFTHLAGGKVNQLDVESVWNLFQTTVLGQVAYVWIMNGAFFERLGDYFNQIVGILVFGLVETLFFLAAAIIYLLFALIMIVRVFMLCLLVIVAPIAFLTLISKETKEIKMFFPGPLNWDEWWPTLVQWAFIGVPLGFWLFLSNKLLEVGGTIFTSPFQSPELLLETGTLDLKAAFAGLFQSILIPGISVLSLYIGITTSFSAMPTIAKGAVELGKKAGKKAGTAALGYTAGVARERLAESPRVQRLAQRMATAETPGTGLTKAFATPIWGAGRRIGQAIGPAIIESERATIDKSEEKIKGKAVNTQLAAFRAARSDRERLGVLQGIIKDRNINTAMEATRRGAITNAEIQRLYGVAQRYNKESVIRSAFPGIARQNLLADPTFAPNLPLADRQREASRTVFNRIKPTDYENMSEGVLQDDDFLETLLRIGRSSHVSKFIDRFQREGDVALANRLRNLTATALQIAPAAITPQQMYRWLESVNNPALARYLQRSAARGLIHI